MKVHIKSPTRVDLAGGTLDLWPLSVMVGPVLTVNVAISIYTTVDIETSEGLEIHSKDLNKVWTFPSVAELLKSPDRDLRLFQELFRSGFQELKGLKVVTQSQSPVGGGLGGSSSLVISLLKALHQWTHRTLPSIGELVEWAHNIEARVLGTPTGTQDYFPAAQGGLNFLTYHDRGISTEILPIPDQSPMKDHFVLVYTGRSHHSGINNFDVLTRAVKGETEVLEALRALRSVSERMAQALRTQNWAQIKSLFDEEYAARIRLSPSFSSPEIEALKKLSEGHGGSAAKICGAGGGGCVLLWVPPASREKVVQACQSAGFQVLSAQPVGPLPVEAALGKTSH